LKDDDPVTVKLCEAYRAEMLQRIENVRAEVRSVKDTILVGLTISTLILTLVMYVLKVV